jgi:heme/copper-type cytochrome/quinol oxidase subunit 4
MLVAKNLSDYMEKSRVFAKGNIYPQLYKFINMSAKNDGSLNIWNIILLLVLYCYQLYAFVFCLQNIQN